MPWHVAKRADCPAGKPFAVVKDADGSIIPGGCHATREDAIRHLVALHLSEHGLSQ